MKKKTKMRIVTASTVVASTFVANAPFTEAATVSSVDLAIENYKTKAWETYQSWQPKEDELVWAMYVKPHIRDAENAYATALALINQSALTKKEKEEK